MCVRNIGVGFYKLDIFPINLDFRKVWVVGLFGCAVVLK